MSPVYHLSGSLLLDLMHASFADPQNPLAVIQAAVLLCTWPPPIHLVSKDRTHTIAGAAMNLAIQHGLHAFTRENEFVNQSRQPDASRDRPTASPESLTERLRDEAVAFRARLWEHAQIVFQR